MLYEHIPFLQPIAFKIPAHLSVDSDTVKAAVQHAHTLSLVSGSHFQLLDSILVCAQRTVD